MGCAVCIVHAHPLSDDRFYVVESGGVDVRDPSGVTIHAGPLSVIGELALLYDTPQRGVFHAGPRGCCVWSLDRGSYRSILASTAAAKLKDTRRALKKAPLLRGLTKEQVRPQTPMSPPRLSPTLPRGGFPCCVCASAAESGPHTPPPPSPPPPCRLQFAVPLRVGVGLAHDSFAPPLLCPARPRLTPAPVPQLHRLADAVREVSFRCGDVIIRKGDIGDALFFLAEGLVKCTDIGTGGRQTRDIILEPGKVSRDGEGTVVETDEICFRFLCGNAAVPLANSLPLLLLLVHFVPLL